MTKRVPDKQSEMISIPMFLTPIIGSSPLKPSTLGCIFCNSCKSMACPSLGGKTSLSSLGEVICVHSKILPVDTNSHSLSQLLCGIKYTMQINATKDATNK